MPEATSTVLEETLSVSGQFFSNLSALLLHLHENAGDYLWNLLSVVVIFLGAKLVMGAISFVTGRVMHSKRYHSTLQQGKRIDTMMTLLRSVARYVIYFIVILLSLSALGFGSVTKNLLLTAGVGSLAIGIGAQSLVKDVVTGLFMLFENQFSVGDFIKTDEAEGTVEAAAMRVTYLRSLRGDQIIIPNGSITRVVNYTRGGSLALITVSTAYEADTRAVIEILRQAVAGYAEQHEDLIEEPPFVQGITGFGTSSVDIGIICKARQMKQWEVERGMRLAVKEQFDRLGVQFPYPHVVTKPYCSSAPLPLAQEESEEVETVLADWQNADD